MGKDRIKNNLERMHSSRMRTAHAFTVCWSLLPGGGAAWSGGCTCSRGGCTCLVRGGVPGQVPPPPVDRMTHAFENITLPQTSFVGGNK